MIYGEGPASVASTNSVLTRNEVIINLGPIKSTFFPDFFDEKWGRSNNAFSVYSGTAIRVIQTGRDRPGEGTRWRFANDSYDRASGRFGRFMATLSCHSAAYGALSSLLNVGRGF